MRANPNKGAIMDALRQGFESRGKRTGSREPKALDEKQAWKDVASVIGLADPASGGAKEPKAKFAAAIKALAEAQSRLKEIADTASTAEILTNLWREADADDEGNSHIAVDDVQSEIGRVDSEIEGMRKWLDAASKKLGKRGRPVGSKIETLIALLAPIYAAHTGAAISFTREYHREREGSKGAFLNLVCAVALARNEFVKPETVGDAIKKMRRTETLDSPQHDYEPVRAFDAAVFARFKP